MSVIALVLVGSNFEYPYFSFFIQLIYEISFAKTIPLFKKTTGSYEKPGGKKTGYEAVV
jgi:hypothetical protein